MAPIVDRALPGETDLDLSILREMYRSRGVEVSGIDPRLNPTEVSRRLRVSRARVASRLRAWSEFGFLDRYDVWPNPFVFGLTGVWLDVRVDDRLDKESVLERIGLIPGAVGALDLVGDWIGATFVHPIGEDPARIAALVRSLSGVAKVEGPTVWGIAGPDHSPSPLDFRIIRVLRAHPRDSLASIARLAGVSTRTLTTRYSRLIDERAVWFIPILDFRAIAEPILSVGVQFASASDREAFGRALHRHHPRSIEVFRGPIGPPIAEDRGSYFVIARSAARVEEFERWIRGCPGVVSHEVYTLVRLISFPATFDRLMTSTDASARVR